MKEYDVIKQFYGTQVAARSGVPLMNHIDEGCELLVAWLRPDIELAAFCLHPIVQNDEPADATWVTWSEAYDLACEYRDRANAYLCRTDTDWIQTPDDLAMHMQPMSTACAYLLLADKVQNQKDFLIYHSLTHPRAAELQRYFSVWIGYLLKEIKDANTV